jgi:transcriptional regulator with XRE-family HTH domain
MAAQDRSPEGDARAMLGELLKDARLAGGFRTQGDLADALGVDRTGITRTETGYRLPNAEVLGEWLDQCGVTGLARKAIEGLYRLARAWEEPGKARTAPWFEAEARSHALRYWAPVIVPGMFQTPAYTRALTTVMGYDEATISANVDARMARQAILGQPAPPDVTVVLWEPVLHHLIGSPEVMREQLARLLELSRRPTIMVQILPGRIGANTGLGGAINLAATADAPELLLSEALVEDAVTADPALVRRASSTFNSVRADALNRADSREAISEAMEAWN